jgi:hypothetical protein
MWNWRLVKVLHFLDFFYYKIIVHLLFVMHRYFIQVKSLFSNLNTMESSKIHLSKILFDQS